MANELRGLVHMSIEQDRLDMRYFAAGYLAGMMSKDPEISFVRPLMDDNGTVTGELSFMYSGWNFSIGIEAHDRFTVEGA